MKRKVLTAVSLVVFIIGVGLLLYPSLSKSINEQKMNNIVEDFNEAVEYMNSVDKNKSSDDEKEPKEKSNKAPKLKLDKELLDKLYLESKAYNEGLIENGQSSYGDPFIFSDASVDLSTYGIENGLFGYISVPAIDMNLPIYLGANEYNMAIGATHMNNTSLPLGGESTNCALAGHRGMINKIMFDNIVYLNEGDDVYIVNYWEKLHYKVRATKIINPNSTNEILIEKGEDLVTLITCHPYGSNAQRFLVICERVY